MEDSEPRPSFIDKVQSLFGITRTARRRLLDYRINDSERSAQDDEWTAKAINAVAKKLEKRRGAIDNLLHALSNPHSVSRCVTIPRSLDGRLQIAMRKGLPHVIFCKLWRWPDLVSHHELKPVEHCRSPFSLARGEEVCINPYHYERVLPPELPHVVVPRVVNQQQHERQMMMMHHQQQNQCAYQQQQQAQIVQPNAANMSADLPADVIALVESYDPLGRPHVAQQQQQPQQQQQQNHNGNNQPRGIAYEEVLNQNFDRTPDSAYASSESTSAQSSYSSGSCLSPKSWSPPTPENQAITQNGAFTGEQNKMPQQQSNDANAMQNNLQNPAVVPYVQQPDWAVIAYYELNTRVGEVFYCKSSRVIVDGYTCPMSSSSLQSDLTYAQTTRFCLGQFSNVHRQPSIENTRHHIGKGIELIYVCGQIWVSCHSDSAIFVQSLCSNAERGLQPEAVDKIPNGMDFKIFDEKYFSCVIGQRVYQGYQAVYDLAKWCTIRLSFVKGWGQNYPRRRDVVETPCWIELRVHAPLKWIDNVVSQMVPGNSINSVT